MDTIRIHTEKPVLEIRSTPAKMHITNAKPTMRIRNPRPVMRVRRRAPTFRIVNNKIVKSQTGNPSPEQAMLRYRDRGNQGAHQAIGSTASLYDRLMYAEPYGSNIGVLTKNRMQAELPELNVGAVPKERPQLEWEDGDLVIEWDTSDLVIEWDGNGRPQIEVEPYSVEVRLRNKPSVKIYLTNNNRKNETGGKVDRQA